MKCIKCGNDFIQTPYQVRKFEYSCRECTKKRFQAWRKKKIALGFIFKFPSEDKEWLKEYNKRPEVKIRHREAWKRYYRKPINLLKAKARWITKKAIQDGKILKKPCEFCGKEKVEVHHPDYFKPLEIKWLCRECHLKEHARLRKIETEKHSKGEK